MKPEERRSVVTAVVDPPFEIKDLHIGFWIFVSDMALTTCINATSVSLGSGMLKKNYHWSTQQSSFIITLPYTVGIFAMPVAGLLADKYGNRMTMVLVAGLLMAFEHLIYVMLPDCHRCWFSVVPFALQGFSATVN